MPGGTNYRKTPFPCFPELSDAFQIHPQKIPPSAVALGPGSLATDEHFWGTISWRSVFKFFLKALGEGTSSGSWTPAAALAVNLPHNSRLFKFSPNSTQWTSKFFI